MAAKQITVSLLSERKRLACEVAEDGPWGLISDTSVTENVITIITLGIYYDALSMQLHSYPRFTIQDVCFVITGFV